MRKKRERLFNEVRGWPNSEGITINLFFTIIIIVFIFFSLYNNYIIRSYRETSQRLTSDYYNVVTMKDHIVQCNVSLNEYLRSGNRTNLADFNRNAATFRAILRDIAGRQANIETLYVMRSMEDSFDTYYSNSSLACFKWYQNDTDYYTYMYSAQSINSYLQSYCDNLLVLLLEDGQEADRQMQVQQGILSRFNLAAILLMLGMLGVSILYVNLRVTNPIRQLVQAAQRIGQGDFDVEIEADRRDGSISVLSESFNFMTRNVKAMMEGMKEKAETERNLLVEQQKNAEYKQMLSQANFLVLQSQTNPHFMFNTLNSISRTITLGMKDEAVMMIDAMSVLLRYNLTDADEPVTLSEEIHITGQYLKIQQYRFQDRITTRMLYDPEFTDAVYVPRFILQPIVENAIIHGLEPLEEGGQLKIRAYCRGENIVIKIMDNGVGIRREILERIRAGRPVRQKGNSIGISNTKKRIELFTGREDSFRMKSKPGKGTVTVITIPLSKAKGGKNV